MKILIIGQCTLHWGRMEFGNIGNYYIMEPLIRGIHDAFPDAEIRTTLQMSEDFCRREKVKVVPMELYYGWAKDDLQIALEELAIAELYSKYGFLAKATPFIREVERSDLVIDFSGDIWGDNANFLGQDRFLVGLCKDRVAQLLGKKTAMIAGSPGPFTDNKITNFAKEVYEAFDLVTNREAISSDLLQEQGFSVANTKSLACPSFLFEPSRGKQRTNKLLREEGLSKNDRPLVGFILCGWNFEKGPFDKWPREDREYAVFVEAVEYLINQKGCQVALMSHANGFDVPPAPFVLKHGRDYPIVRQLHEILLRRGNIDAENLRLVEGVYDAWDTKSLIGGFDMLVSGRVHGAIAGLSQGIPTVILDYGHEPKAHKLKGFAKLVDMDRYVSDPTNRDDIIEKIDRCFANRATITSELQARLPAVKELARENFDLLSKMFNKSQI